MCHEGWWRERRARRAEEAQEIWHDFDRTPPADVPEVADPRPEEVRLDADEREVVSIDR